MKTLDNFCIVDTIKNTEGFKVEAITDAFGPQVVVTTQEDSFISPQQINHETAVVLAKCVAAGSQIYKHWKTVNDISLDEVLLAIAFPYKG